MCCVTSIVCVRKISTFDKSISHILAVLAGTLSYAAYNIRTIYLYCIPAIIIYIIINELRDLNVVKCFFKVGLFLVGNGIMAIPQFYVNKSLTGIASWRVNTGSLQMQQLVWGLQYQQYATNISGDGTGAQVLFEDCVGSRIIKMEHIDSTITFGGYLKLLIKYPFEMVGIMFRHFVNMLLPCWPEQYITNLNNSKIPIAIFVSLSIFIFISAVIINKINLEDIWKYVIVLIPVALITPGAVESRFYMGLFVVMYGLIIWKMDWKEYLNTLRKNKMVFLVGYLAMFAVMICVWTTCLSSRVEAPMIYMEGVYR